MGPLTGLRISRRQETRSDLCADGGGCIKVRFFWPADESPNCSCARDRGRKAETQRGSVHRHLPDARKARILSKKFVRGFSEREWSDGDFAARKRKDRLTAAHALGHVIRGSLLSRQTWRVNLRPQELRPIHRCGMVWAIFEFRRLPHP